MEIKYYAQTLSPKLKYLELYILSDLHYGNPFCDIKSFFHQIEYIKSTPHAYVIFNGDLCEAALKASKGDTYEQAPSPKKQRDYLIEILKPISDKVLGMTTGNHEDRICRDTSIDISEDIAKELKCPYDPDGLYLKLSFGNYSKGVKGRPFVYWISTSHGYGGARTKSAKAVKAERLATWLHADVTAMSHDHVVNASPDVYLMPDKRTTPEKDDHGNETGFMVGKVIAHRKELVKTNAFLKWGGYSRKLGFPPVDLVTPTILLAGQQCPWPSNGYRNKPEVRVIV